MTLGDSERFQIATKLRKNDTSEDFLLSFLDDEVDDKDDEDEDDDDDEEEDDEDEDEDADADGEDEED